jgi:hypothetical protein
MPPGETRLTLALRRRRPDARPLRPPNGPLPDSSPNKPAPRKPPISIPPKPPKSEGAAVVAGGLTRGVAARAPGWVIDRSIGAAAFGAVGVGGAASNVRLPRLPKLLPPPARASAASTANASAAVSASVKTLRRENDMKTLSTRKTAYAAYSCIWLLDPIVTPAGVAGVCCTVLRMRGLPPVQASHCQRGHC